ncbi:NAD(P)-dependent oxidoreductase [Planctomycetaceae bacterium SH139]
MLSLPGPDFVDRVWAVSDRSPGVLRSMQQMFNHVPANSHTYHLIGEEEFKQMKDGVVLLNTARGSLIDEKAMVRALSVAKLVGAGLDVLPQEPVIREEAELLRSVYEAGNPLDSLLAGQVLIRIWNVVVTPHSAFNTRDAVQRIVTTTAEHIQSFLDGELQNKVGLKLALEFLNLTSKLWFVFNLRDHDAKRFNNDILRNRWLWVAIGLCICLLLAAVYLPGLSDVLQTRQLNATGWGLVLLLSLAPALLGLVVPGMRFYSAGKRHQSTDED